MGLSRDAFMHTKEIFMMAFIMVQKDVQRCFTRERFHGRIQWGTGGKYNGHLWKVHNAKVDLKSGKCNPWQALKCLHYLFVLLKSKLPRTDYCRKVKHKLAQLPD